MWGCAREGAIQGLAPSCAHAKSAYRATRSDRRENSKASGGCQPYPAHLEASFDWFRTFPQDVKDDAVDQHTKLAMPVLAIGADHSLGAAEATQVHQYATHVTGMVIKSSGHWIYEEHSAQMTQILLNFLH
ncbi:MAG TPA: hypothetical protein VH594_25210 [Trebonia sp.]|jgi:pimeloyl-ACP methyl ester carboxylesterase